MLDNLGYRHVTIGRCAFWVHEASGRVLPSIMGGDGDEGAAPPLSPEQQAAVQAEVQRIAAGIRDEAKASGAKETEDRITGYLAAEAEKQRLASLEGEEKLREEIRAANEARAAAEQAAAQERLDIRVERKLIAAGVGIGIPDDPDGKKAEAALARARRVLTLSTDATDEDIDRELAAAKAEIPSLFTKADAGSTPTPTTAPTPPAKPASPDSQTETVFERGQRLAREKYGHLARTA